MAPVRGGGVLMVHGEEVASCSEFLSVKLSGLKLKNKAGMFGTSDPFITASRMNEAGHAVRFWASKHVDNNLSPRWEMMQVSLQTACNGDVDRPLVFEIFDWMSSGNHVSMGSFQTSARELLDAGVGHRFAVTDSKNKSRGHVVIDACTIERHNTMIDFLRGGMEINVVVAIDYTGSNGNPAMPGTLHYVDPTGRTLNQYELAIMSVLRTLQDYDHDAQFPVYGFGGKVLEGGARKVSHCFPVADEVSLHERC